MRFSNNSSIYLFIILLFQVNIYAQKNEKKMFKADSQNAESYFEKAEFDKAAKAYAEIIVLYPNRVRSDQYLNAAISCTKTKDMKSARTFFNSLANVATSSEMEEVRTASFLKQYHAELWWKNLMAAFDTRMEDLIMHHKTLNIFSHNKEILYSALRLSSKGDTLANTQIHLRPDGTGWGNVAAASQSQILCQYDFLEQDSLDHISELKEIVMERFFT